jgi:hypothetical protein
VDALPLTGLNRNLSAPDMPWEAGWEQLEEGLADPASRLLLAAHLLCRAARAEVYLFEDQAQRWLTSSGDDGTGRAETAALTLLAGAEEPARLVALVEALVEQVNRKPVTAARTWGEGQHPDQVWRAAAVTSAQRVAKQLAASPLGRVLGPYRRNRGDRG